VLSGDTTHHDDCKFSLFFQGCSQIKLYPVEFYLGNGWELEKTNSEKNLAKHMGRFLYNKFEGQQSLKIFYEKCLQSAVHVLLEKKNQKNYYFFHNLWTSPRIITGVGYLDSDGLSALEIGFQNPGPPRLFYQCSLGSSARILAVPSNNPHHNFLSINIQLTVNGGSGVFTRKFEKDWALEHMNHWIKLPNLLSCSIPPSNRANCWEWSRSFY